jgi:formylglycine-generating enzyme required for sulfatase activity
MGLADDMRWIPGGTFRMGSDRFYPEEGPAHLVEVAGFRIDTHPVTNAAFAQFVAATGYVTLAEQPIDPAEFPDTPPELLQPGGLVFHAPTGSVDLRDVSSWWRYVPGADWRHPDGPETTIAGRDNDPVVQIAWHDAIAFAAWAGKRLPNEAEWEFAARGGLDGDTWCWGEEMTPDGRWMANTWQGEFPRVNTGVDGFAGRSPAGAFPANGYGIYDMAGNVWEWTVTEFTARHTEQPAPCCHGRSRRGTIPRKVVKGGSYLCAPNYCLRYRPAARQPQSVDTATCHVGFRCVRDE